MVQANEVLHLMNEKSFPSLASYNILLHGFAKQHELSKCFTLYNAILRRGFLADNLTCYSLILGLCNSHNVELAVKCLKKMILKGNIPDQECFLIELRMTASSMVSTESLLSGSHKWFFMKCWPGVMFLNADNMQL